MKKTQTLLILLFSIFSLSAQEIMLKGTVYDISNNEALPFVIVSIKGTITGVMTDKDGNYSLSCKMGDVIRVSYIGFSDIEWTVDCPVKFFYLKEKEDSTYPPLYVNPIRKQHSISLAPTYSFKDKKLGSAFSYKFSINKNSWSSNYLNLSATYARPNWSKDGLFSPQFVFSKTIFPRLINWQYFSVSGGVGYYWNVDNNLKFKSGDYAFSTNLHFAKKTTYSRRYTFRYELFTGYNWFVNRYESDYFSIGITIYPSKRIFLYE